MKSKENILNNQFLPYIIKWGKITTWFSIPFIFIPPLMLVLKFGARVTMGQVIAGLIPAVSAMIVWYIVDPIALYPILGIPGLYITYIAGNSKEIRGPAAMMSTQAAGVKLGTPEGTIISTFGIALSVFISVTFLTMGALIGDYLLAMASQQVKEALNYLLPALFGAMLAQSIVSNYKNALIALPIAIVARVLTINGAFSMLPGGGSYVSILLSVFGTMFIVKTLYNKNNTKESSED